MLNKISKRITKLILSSQHIPKNPYFIKKISPTITNNLFNRVTNPCVLHYNFSNLIKSGNDSEVKYSKSQVEAILRNLKLNSDDLTWKYVRGGGKGGQKVNKTNNCVILTHLPTGV